RRQREDPFIRAGRNDILLQHELYPVGKRLEDAIRPDSHWPKPDLNPGGDFSFRQSQKRNNAGDNVEHDEYLDERNKDVIDSKIHHRSISPSTMSRVPMIATTSATICPATIFFSDCRFTNDGGRTRVRYACVLAS